MEFVNYDYSNYDYAYNEYYLKYVENGTFKKHQKKYYERNKKYIREQHKKYYNDNKEYIRLKNQSKKQ